MKGKEQVVALLLIFCMTTAFQCEKECKSGEYRLDASRSWLPLKGKTQLTFLDNAGIISNFNLNVYDTVETNVKPDCTIIYESINVFLFLNPPLSDVITLRLNPPNSLVVSGSSGNNPGFHMRDVFQKAREGSVAKRLSNYTIGGRTYGEVILMLNSVGNSNSIDSVFIANNVGIVGFKHMGKKYSLQ